MATSAAPTSGTIPRHRYVSRGGDQLHTIFERQFDEEGAFVSVPLSDLQAKTEVFRRRVIWLPVEKELPSEESARNLLS